MRGEGPTSLIRCGAPGTFWWRCAAAGDPRRSRKWVKYWAANWPWQAWEWRWLDFPRQSRVSSCWHFL